MLITINIIIIFMLFVIFMSPDDADDSEENMSGLKPRECVGFAAFEAAMCHYR